MRIPADWDKPSPDNSILCEKFEYGIFEDQGRLPYRIFKPAADKSAGKVPLVVYLHGADAFGNDNEAQLSMHDIGTAFARDHRQEKNPCYILAPQCKPSSHWAGSESGRRLIALISSIISEYPDIDAGRLYIYGYSAGGIGALKLIKQNPGLFTAGIPICAATDREDLDTLTTIPLWLFHAADDEIVKASYSDDLFTSTHLGSREIYELLKDRAPEMKYTEYPAGYMKKEYGINPHCTWVPVSHDDEAMEWLFSKRK